MNTKPLRTASMLVLATLALGACRTTDESMSPPPADESMPPSSTMPPSESPTDNTPTPPTTTPPTTDPATTPPPATPSAR